MSDRTGPNLGSGLVALLAIVLVILGIAGGIVLLGMTAVWVSGINSAPKVHSTNSVAIPAVQTIDNPVAELPPIIHDEYIVTESVAIPESIPVAECDEGFARAEDMTCVPVTYWDNVAPKVTLGACVTEDSTDCYWDAQTRGNGMGTSFVNIGGTVYLFG
jgi:hypothetical protein